MKRSLLLFATIALMAVGAYANVPDTPRDASDAFGLFCVAVGAMTVVPVALRAIGVRLPLGMLMATTISTSALQAAYGTEFNNESKSLKDLVSKLYETAEFDKLFTITYTDLTVWEKAVSSSSAVVQGFQLAHTPNGTLTFRPSKIPLFDIKADLLFSSHSIKRDWIGFMHKTGVPQNAQQFVKYVLNDLVAKQYVEDIELYCCYLGEFLAPTANVAGPSIRAMNGIRKVINDAITAGTITPIVTGAPPSGALDYVNYIEAFCADISNTDKRTPMTLAVSLTGEELFKEGMRLKYNQYYRDAENVLRVYTRNNILVSGQRAMDDDTKIFCSPKDNSFKVVNMGTGPLFNLETVDRSIKVWGDHLMGYGFWNHDRVYTNDQSLLDEQS